MQGSLDKRYVKGKYSGSGLLAVLIIFLMFAASGFAQTDSTGNLNKKRLRTVLICEGALYGSTMYLLNDLWYADYPRSNFHFFNDNSEWLQMDKYGHATTAYYVSKVGFQVNQWAGLNHKQSVWYGAGLAYAFQMTIETFDGFSEQWGASIGDIAANTFGSGLFIAQELGWKEQRVLMKFSFHQSEYSQYRPNLLGHTLVENLVKDYNGQTYWLSANLRSFIGGETKIPKWLNLALGYGAEGMLGGHENPKAINGIYLPSFERQRQFYFSLDIDLTRVKTKSKFANSLLSTFGFIKFPMPTLEWNDRRLKLHPIFF